MSEMKSVAMRLDDDVSTDRIYPGRYMATVLPSETPKYCFADDAEFNRQLCAGKIPGGSVIVAGKNFGCGSSREQAASAINGYGITVIAKSFARIFLRNAINVGLQLVICPDIEADTGDLLNVLPDKVENTAKGKTFAVTPLPAAQQEIINAGGFVPYVRKRLILERGTSAAQPAAISVEGPQQSSGEPAKGEVHEP